MKAGRTLVGARWNYRLIEPIERGVHKSTVFKAEVLCKDGLDVPAKWALIKTTQPDDEAGKTSLKREYDAYQRPSIASSTDFRAMHDVVGDLENLESDVNESIPCLVLEWHDCTLEDVPLERHRQNCVLFEAILKSCLSGLVTLGKDDLVHTDLKPTNILLSNVDTGHPIVKIGDLGSMRPAGFKGPAQPFAMRAPEAYQGLGCVHHSEVWPLAATLFCWIKPGVLGNFGNNYYLPQEGWCIAKFMRLFPEWTGPPTSTVDREIQLNFNLGKAIAEESAKEGQNDLVTVSSLEEELHNMDLPKEVKDLLRYLFVPDPDKRPSAADALASDVFQALKRAARASPIGHK